MRRASRIPALAAVVVLGLVAVDFADAQAPQPDVRRSDQVFKVVTRLVEVHATVTQGKRRYVRGLAKENFRVYDNAAPQEISVFESDESGFSSALLLDTTGSMKKALPTLKRAVLEFIDMLRPVDSVAVYSFSTQLARLQSFTRDKSDVKRAVLKTRASGATALFDSVYRVAQDLTAVEGKKALLVFTDGDDNSSVLNARSTIRRARMIGIPVFAAAQGQALENKELLKQIHELAEATGGLAFEMKKSDHARRIFGEISASLRHSYLLGYRAPQAEAAGWRTIRLEVSGVKRPRIRAKGGYQVSQ
ncbi:MAG: VWA domain-containing protein [Bryobacterales bacterium]|nr:VWA domain-containing protein [Bryobacterales bacterium]MDE0264061.1 VWA domain-containing protein [Bryobacterales bacterium]MDE0620726.1 VWA domain-containing protein [Bryobacterales bacterium]